MPAHLVQQAVTGLCLKQRSSTWSQKGQSEAPSSPSVLHIGDIGGVELGRIADAALSRPGQRLGLVSSLPDEEEQSALQLVDEHPKIGFSSGAREGDVTIQSFMVLYDAKRALKGVADDQELSASRNR